MSDIERCDYCGRRTDRPSFGCIVPTHPNPTLAQSIVQAVERELCGRRGVGYDGVDPDIQDEIRDRLAEIVASHLKETP